MISRRARQIPSLHLKPIAPLLETGLHILIHILNLLPVSKLILNIHPTHLRKVIHRMVMVCKAIRCLVFQVNIFLQQIVLSPLLRVNFQDNMNIHYPLVPRRWVNILQALPRQDNIFQQDNILQQDNISLQDNTLHLHNFQMGNIFHLQVSLQHTVLGFLRPEITHCQESRFLILKVLTRSLLPTNLDITLPRLQTSLHGT